MDRLLGIVENATPHGLLDCPLNLISNLLGYTCPPCPQSPGWDLTTYHLCIPGPLTSYFMGQL